jgi:hypothetical protein
MIDIHLKYYIIILTLHLNRKKKGQEFTVVFLISLFLCKILLDLFSCEVELINSIYE